MSANDNKILRDITGANLLSHHLSSTEKHRAKVFLALGEIELKKTDPYEVIYTNAHKFRKLLVLLAGDPESREQLVYRINVLLKLLDEPIITEDYLATCIRLVHEALNFALMMNFGIKEDLVNNSMLAILQNVGVLQTKAIVPKAYYNEVDELLKENENNEY